MHLQGHLPSRDSSPVRDTTAGIPSETGADDTTTAIENGTGLVWICQTCNKPYKKEGFLLRVRRLSPFHRQVLIVSSILEMSITCPHQTIHNGEAMRNPILNLGVYLE